MRVKAFFSSPRYPHGQILYCDKYLRRCAHQVALQKPGSTQSQACQHVQWKVLLLYSTRPLCSTDSRVLCRYGPLPPSLQQTWADREALNNNSSSRYARSRSNLAPIACHLFSWMVPHFNLGNSDRQSPGKPSRPLYVPIYYPIHTRPHYRTLLVSNPVWHHTELGSPW